MKIRLARPSDNLTLYNHWKDVFNFDDYGSIDAYFEHVYKPENCYVLLIDDEIACSLMVHPHKMVLHQKVVEVAFIVGVYTIEKYRHQGHMKTLLNYVLKDLEYNYLLTLIQAYHPDLYTQFGFENVYQQRVYQVKRSMIKPMDSVGIKISQNLADNVELYQFYTKYFNGYFVRDEEYYHRMMKLVAAENGQYVSLYNHENDLTAHLRMVVHDQDVIVDELLYKDTASLIKILSYVMSKYPRLEVHVSMVEDLEKLLGAIHLRDEVSMMVKLNDENCFERLFNVKVKRADSAMKAFSKPLFNTDFY